MRHRTLCHVKMLLAATFKPFGSRTSERHLPTIPAVFFGGFFRLTFFRLTFAPETRPGTSDQNWNSSCCSKFATRNLGYFCDALGGFTGSMFHPHRYTRSMLVRSQALAIHIENFELVHILISTRYRRIAVIATHPKISKTQAYACNKDQRIERIPFLPLHSQPLSSTH